jgi:hypothetical protein
MALLLITRKQNGSAKKNQNEKQYKLDFRLHNDTLLS